MQGRGGGRKKSRRMTVRTRSSLQGPQSMQSPANLLNTQALLEDDASIGLLSVGQPQTLLGRVGATASGLWRNDGSAKKVVPLGVAGESEKLRVQTI